jgi:hypothetical protein
MSPTVKEFASLPFLDRNRRSFFAIFIRLRAHLMAWTTQRRRALAPPGVFVSSANERFKFSSVASTLGPCPARLPRTIWFGATDA